MCGVMNVSQLLGELVGVKEFKEILCAIVKRRL